MKEQDLLKLKKEVQESKDAVLKLEGEKDALFKQLKKEDCDSIEDLKALLKKLEKQENKLDVKIKDGLTELEKKL